MSEELFDVVDENDCVVEILPRSEVHRRGLKHRAVHIFVFRSDDRLLIHFRSDSKEEFPSVWTSSASGHVSSGEDYQSSAERELREELGIQTSVMRFAKFAACPETSNEFTELFLARSDAPVVFDREEIQDIQWLDVDEVAMRIASNPESFSPAFRLLFAAYRERH